MEMEKGGAVQEVHTTSVIPLHDIPLLIALSPGGDRRMTAVARSSAVRAMSVVDGNNPELAPCAAHPPAPPPAPESVGRCCLTASVHWVMASSSACAAAISPLTPSLLLMAAVSWSLNNNSTFRPSSTQLTND